MWVVELRNTKMTSRNFTSKPDFCVSSKFRNAKHTAHEQCVRPGDEATTHSKMGSTGGSELPASRTFDSRFPPLSPSTEIKTLNDRNIVNVFALLLMSFTNKCIIYALNRWKGVGSDEGPTLGTPAAFQSHHSGLIILSTFSNFKSQKFFLEMFASV